MNRTADIEQCAADWLARTEEADFGPEDQCRLDAWLEQSMAHKAAFWRLRHGWRQADRIRALGSNLFAASAKQGLWTGQWRWAIAASLLLTTGVGLHYWPRASGDKPAVMQFETPVGGRSVVRLPDGSVIELNTATRVRAAFAARGREVWLERGEAFFQVVHQARPFLVHAGNRVITDLGTKFSVRQADDSTVVSVVEGRVKISDAVNSSPSPTAILGGGEIAVARAKSTMLTPVSEDQLQQELAWRKGNLVFDRATLAEVARQFNRYNGVQILVPEDATAKIEISGTFQASNVDAFVRLMREAYGLRVHTSDERLVITS